MMHLLKAVFEDPRKTVHTFVCIELRFARNFQF
jgi:hypothetical protein